MTLCNDCFKGVTHEGTPQGKWETIGNVECYVATPTVPYPKHQVVLFLCDAFGPQLINSQLLADDFARNGFKVIAPDYFNGDGAPADALEPGSTYDGAAWLTRHGPEETRPPLDKVIKALKEAGVTWFSGVGYCIGGRYVFDLAFENILNVSVVSHPSTLKIPGDLEKYASLSRAPLLINSCTVDMYFPRKAQAKAEELLGGGKFVPGYKQVYWEGCTHGFAVRGDLGNPKVKAAKEGAFREAVEWLRGNWWVKSNL